MNVTSKTLQFAILKVPDYNLSSILLLDVNSIGDHGSQSPALCFTGQKFKHQHSTAAWYEETEDTPNNSNQVTVSA